MSTPHAAEEEEVAAGCRTERDRIRIRQDVGSLYPVWKTVALILWSDGSTGWDAELGVSPADPFAED